MLLRALNSGDDHFYRTQHVSNTLSLFAHLNQAGAWGGRERASIEKTVANTKVATIGNRELHKRLDSE